jgi:hypothetical protein
VALAAGDVTNDTCDLLPFATMVVLLKKTEEDTEALRLKQGQQHQQPQRPMGMGSNIPKIAANCIMDKVQSAVGVSAGAHKFDVDAKGGCDMVHWIL